ncbi:MAG: glycosyltransferase family 2 protein [Chloroflexota bacterium]|nr:glycosyltransferase family 2 protein [Chloroflexota bacterium]
MTTHDRPDGGRPLVEVVLPAYNEELDLPRSVETLVAYLRTQPQHAWRVLVADNASTDGTLATAQALAEAHPEVEVFHLPQKGRGRALRAAWLASDADAVCYMDVDLSTGLDALPPLIDAVLDGGYDIAIGTRLARGSRVYRRTLKREITSRGYNLLIKSMFWTRFSDAQCGFKALNRAAARRLLPLVKDNAFFFDTELLLIAEKRGLRIFEVPVTWTDDPGTTVRIVNTAMEDIRGLLRLRFGGIPKLP